MSVASAINLEPAVLGGGGGSQTLAQVLTTGNSAGSSDINMNNNDITGANAITANFFTGDLTGNALSAFTATTATNIAGGLGGSIPYQSALATTALLANGTAGQVLQSNGTTLAPSWITPASSGLTYYVQTSISPTPIFNYNNPVEFLNDILSIPNVPAGTYNLFAMFAGNINDSMSVQSCRFYTGANATGTELLNYYNSSTPINNGTVPFSMNGIVTLASTTTLYLYVELLFTTSTASTWEVINLNTGYIKIA